jgi:flagellar M-ring protein FliF
MATLPASTGPANAGTNRQLRLLIVVFVVLAALLVAAYFLLLRKEWAVLYTDLRPAEASAVVTELDKQQVEYKLAAGGSQILVAADELDAVHLSVSAAELPVKGLEGFELFNNSDMGLTDFTQKIKYQRAMQGELARTIMMMDGVVEARVHISMPERALFRNDQGRPKAAVTLVTRSSEMETPAQVEGVQRLVAAAITDLNVSDVVVLNNRGEVISAAPPVALPASQYPELVAGIASALSRVLPGRRFEVAAESQPPLAGAAPGTPAPRVITISSGAVLTESEQQLVLADLRSGKFLSDSGDTIRFAVLQPAQSPETTADPATQAPKAALPPKTEIAAIAASNGRALPITWLVLGPLGVVVVAVFAILLLRRTRPILSIEDHRRFADRLKLGLELDAQGGQGEKA